MQTLHILDVISCYYSYRAAFCSGQFQPKRQFYICYYSLSSLLHRLYRPRYSLSGSDASCFPGGQKRVKAISFSNIIGSLGSVLPSLLFFTVAGLWGRENQKAGYFGAALIFAALGGIPMFFSAFGFKEKVYIPPKKKSILTDLKLYSKTRNLYV